MRILIVHPEGNITSNPNLAGLAELLSKMGFVVDVLSQRYSDKYQKSMQHWNFISMNSLEVLLKILEGKRGLMYFTLNKLIELSGRKYALIIGVDRTGIILASTVARANNLPLALVSYEIFFHDEISQEEKLAEIEACKEVCFAIAQDDERAGLLSRENRIPLSKILRIPVAGLSCGKMQKTNCLHQKFNIEPSKKVALMIGSLAAWSCIDDILEGLAFWPANWVLVLHNRYVDADIQNRIQKIDSTRNYFSNAPCESFDELRKLVASADLGIALYKPTYNSVYTGKNLKHLGWASGKISTYLQCGVPVLVNEVGMASEAVRKNDLGYVLSEGQRIGDFLKQITDEELEIKKENCLMFFNDFLALDNYKTQISDQIRPIIIMNKTRGNLISFKALDLILSWMLQLYKPYVFAKKIASSLRKKNNSGKGEAALP